MNAAAPRVTTVAGIRQSVVTYLSSIAGTYLFLALSFATSVYLTRRLGADGFGRVTLAFTVVQTAAIFAAFWSHAGVLRYGAEDLARHGHLRHVFWGRAAAVTPVIGVVLALGALWRDEIAAFHGVAGIGFSALVLYFVALLASQTLQVVYQARGRAGLWSFMQSAERAVILLLLLAWGFADAARVIVIYVVGAVSLAIGGLAFANRVDFLPVESSRAEIRRFVVFSWPVLLGVFASYFASNWIDAALIRHYLDVGAVGQYALAYQLMGAVQQVPMLSFPVIVPLLVGAHVGGQNGSLRLYLDRVVPHAIFLMMILLLVGAMVAPPLVPLVFGAAFAESGRALPVLLLAVAFYAVFIAYIPILNLRERTGGMLAASIAAAAANLLGDVLFIPRWGIVGAAWATVASQFAGAAVVACIAYREQPFKIAPSIAFVAPLLLAVVGWTFIDGWFSALSVITGAMLLAAAARAHRLWSDADRRLVASLRLPVLHRWLPPAVERS